MNDPSEPPSLGSSSATHAGDHIPFGLCAYTFPVSCGFLKRDAQREVEQQLDAAGMIKLATTCGLSSVEMPLIGMLPEFSTRNVERLREMVAEAHLTLIVDTGIVEPALLEDLLPLAAKAGARVVRATLSGILEGARTDVAGGWENYLNEMHHRIAAIRPVLEAHDLVLALENHQDATSDDLISLCRAGGSHVGITLDVANPLAVGEEPLEFARKTGPWIRNVHLKDYRIHPTTSGYRLVRCALGEGVIQFPRLLPLLRKVAPEAFLQIELAALYARHIRLLEDDWWRGYPPRDVREVIPVLRMATEQAQPHDADWRTPWEREASMDQVSRYEYQQFEASVRYLRSLPGASKATAHQH